MLNHWRRLKDDVDHADHRSNERSRMWAMWKLLGAIRMASRAVDTLVGRLVGPEDNGKGGYDFV